MSDRNNPNTLTGLRELIARRAAETTLADSKYEYGYVNGWLGAVYWAGEIDRAACDELKAEAKAAFEHAVAALNV